MQTGGKKTFSMTIEDDSVTTTSGLAWLGESDQRQKRHRYFTCELKGGEHSGGPGEKGRLKEEVRNTEGEQMWISRRRGTWSQLCLVRVSHTHQL